MDDEFKSHAMHAERVRDAAMLLSHQRAYREFPAWWVKAALERKGLEAAKFDVFSGKVGTDYVHKQLTWANVEATKVGTIAPELSKGLLDHIAALRKAADAADPLNSPPTRPKPQASKSPDVASDDDNTDKPNS